MKSKCTLLSESGSSLVDMDGRLWKLLNDPYNFNETAIKRIFNRLDKNIDAKTISPRIFEAIYFKTAIIAFPGDYQGILREKNYIKLNKNFSNIKSVLNKIMDTNYLQNLVDRNYNEFVLQKKFTYKNFVQKFDKQVEPHFEKFKKDNFNNLLYINFFP